MKILYGVQGTGNGHISRARAMAEAFTAYPDIDITWLFSGRPRDGYFDMDEFGDFLHRDGLTFFTKNGRLDYLQTVLKNHPVKFRKDIKKLDLEPYDLVMSDYEPITAWALKRSNKPGLGIGHQYAFNHEIPVKGSNPISSTVMNNFAAMPERIGMHWFHFNQPILPPIIDFQHCMSNRLLQNKVLVYLPFDPVQSLLALFKKFPSFEFYIYSPNTNNEDQKNCHTRPLSQTGFKNDLAESAWVISNSGFELISEALQLGKKIMSKPIDGQMEQLSNSLALEMLSLAFVEKNIDQEALSFWFSCDPQPTQIKYPNVAAAITEWVNEGRDEPIENLSKRLWQQTEGFENTKTPKKYFFSPKLL